MEQLIEKWEEILLTLKQEFGIQDISYTTWLKPLEVFSIDNDTLYVLFSSQSANRFGLNYVERNYKDPLMVSIANHTGATYNIKFILPEEAVQLNPNYNNEETNTITSPNYENSGLNKKYTFDSYIVGDNNRFAQTASLAVAESVVNKSESWNPLFLYGGPGLGKTHLMHAIGNFIFHENPDAKILYVTTEEFTNEIVDSIRNNQSSLQKIRDKYRNVDVLMIDDIQFLIGKESTQQEFFHTFNTLHQAGKQIIITSDKPPKELTTLEERITSRFEMGLIADIGYPDYETRMAIIHSKIEKSNIQFPDEVINYIAENIKSNIRHIEGAINKLIAYYNMQNREITLEVAEEELQNIITPDKPRDITPQLIIEVVADHYNISLDQMISKNRSNQIARPRMIAMYLCKSMTDSSLENVGNLLGGRDHSTIIHGSNKIAEEYNTNEDLKKQIDTIKKKINPN